MTRIALLLIAFLAWGGSAEARASLRAVATVEGSVIRLGDLFADAGAHAQDVVAPAPPPGARTIFDARWLADAARAHELDWEPASTFDQAAVARATRIVPADAIIAALNEAIAAEQSVADLELQLDDPGFQLLAPKEALMTLAVEGLAIDRRTGHFSALVAAPADDPAAERRRLSGRLVRMAALPVLDRPVAPGEIIAAADVVIERQRADRVGADALSEARELVGKTPRHALRAHEPVRAGDVQVPLLVHKGDLVTIVLEAPAMRLTAQGKALDDGGRGAVIRVANTKSSRVIDAAVVGANVVSVTPPSEIALRQESRR